MMRELRSVSDVPCPRDRYIRLDGGALLEGMSSSASLPRFLPPPAAGRPRFAADMFGRRGELWYISWMQRAEVGECIPHGCLVGWCWEKQSKVGGKD